MRQKSRGERVAGAGGVHRLHGHALDRERLAAVHDDGAVLAEGQAHVLAVLVDLLGARHGVVQAAVPLLTLAGFLIPRLVAGSLLIEAIFNIPGLGSLLFDAILARDLPVVLALTLLSGVATLLGTTLADVLIVWLDPRVRHAA